MACKINDGGWQVAGGGFRRTAAGVSRGENERAGLWQNFFEKWVIWDADTNSIVVIVIKMMEGWIFGQD